MAGRGGDSLRVAVLAGGRSSEHEVSLSSGAGVRDGLLAGGHEAVWVRIDRDGSWRGEDEQPLSLTPGAGLLGVDVAFPALHGPFGEDGTVQGMLETLDVAYVGSGVTASAVCLDKVLFKQLMAAGGGVPQVDYVGVREGRFRREREAVLGEVARLGLPVFVKPSHLGSSLGIVRVSEPDELAPALEGAFAHDEQVIVEAAASGLEVECGVLGRLAGEGEPAGEDGRGQQGGAMAVAAPPRVALASEPGEIVLGGEWYDFHAKYQPGGMRLQVPAGISASARERVRELAVEVFERAGCAGLARVDFFVEGEQVLVNELNTMPGFTPTSVYAKLMDASGIPYPELVERLCLLGIERHARERAYSH